MTMIIFALTVINDEIFQTKIKWQSFIFKMKFKLKRIKQDGNKELHVLESIRLATFQNLSKRHIHLHSAAEKGRSYSKRLEYSWTTARWQKKLVCCFSFKSSTSFTFIFNIQHSNRVHCEVYTWLSRKRWETWQNSSTCDVTWAFDELCCIWPWYILNVKFTHQVRISLKWWQIEQTVLLPSIWNITLSFN